MTATTELVVPRSIPIILLIFVNPFGLFLPKLFVSEPVYSTGRPKSRRWLGGPRSMACSFVQIEG
jgi:hypothetical protein